MIEVAIVEALAEVFEAGVTAVFVVGYAWAAHPLGCLAALAVAVLALRHPRPGDFATARGAFAVSSACAVATAVLLVVEPRSGGAAYLVIGVMSSYWAGLAVGLGSTRHVRTAAVAGFFALSVWVLVGGVLFSEAHHPWTRAPFASTGLHVEHRAGAAASLEVGEPRLERPVPASFVRATRLSDGDERSFLVKPVLDERSVFVPLRITRGDVVETFVYEFVMDSERHVHATLRADGLLELRRGVEGPLGFPFFADEVVDVVAPLAG